jgi:hypothetical protein
VVPVRSKLVRTMSLNEGRDIFDKNRLLTYLHVSDLVRAQESV